MNVWKKLDNRTYELFQKCNGKTVVLWGYQESGWFVEHLFNQFNHHIDYIIDNGQTIYPKLNIYRSMILDELDKRSLVILFTFQRTESFYEKMINDGYENDQLIFLKDFFYEKTVRKERLLSYNDWLDEKYDTDICNDVSTDILKYDNKEFFQYSTGYSYELKDAINQFTFSNKDAVFDFGYGKGGALLMFKAAGCGKVGGVELSKKLYEIAIENYKKICMCSSGLILGNATTIHEELDEYNIFFFNNPFQGDTFSMVLTNICESVQRKKRDVFIIYSGPTCHKNIVESGIFVCTKKVYCEYSAREVFVYQNLILCSKKM